MSKVMLTICDEPKVWKDVPFTKAEYEAAKKAGDKLVAKITAMEAIKHSKGLYRIKPTESSVDVAVQSVSLEDKDIDELKLMALSAGINLLGGAKGQRKRVSRESLIKAIKLKLSSVDIVEEGEEEDEIEGLE